MLYYAIKDDFGVMEINHRMEIFVQGQLLTEKEISVWSNFLQEKIKKRSIPIETSSRNTHKGFGNTRFLNIGSEYVVKIL